MPLIRLYHCIRFNGTCSKREPTNEENVTNQNQKPCEIDMPLSQTVKKYHNSSDQKKYDDNW